MANPQREERVAEIGRANSGRVCKRGHIGEAAVGRLFKQCLPMKAFKSRRRNLLAKGAKSIATVVRSADI